MYEQVSWRTPDGAGIWLGRASGFAFQSVAEMMGHRNERQQQPQEKEL